MLRIDAFKMMVPKLDPAKTPPDVAIYAENCDNATGILKPIAGPVSVQIIPKPGAIRSIYKCGNTWLAFLSENVSFVRAPSENGRVYYTGDGYPRHTDEALCIAGGIPSLYPSMAYRMGVSRPAAALTVALDKFDDGEEYGDILGVVSYAYTYVHYIDAGYAEESALSPPTVPVPIRGNEKATLTGFAQSVQAGVNNLYFRVYRTLNGNEFEAVPAGRDGNGDFVFDMPVSIGTFVDIDTQTSEIYQNVNITCPVIGWDPLPDDAANLVQFQNGIYAATSGKKVLISELFVPYAFPQGVSSASKDYSYEFPTPPQKIAAFRDMLVVGLESNPYVLAGSDPSLLQMQELPFNQSCVGDMCVTEVGVFYPSPDGLVLCDGVTAIPVTTDTYTIEQWRALNPETLKLFYHDDKLIGFFKGTGTGIIFDFKTGKDVRMINLGAKAFYGGHMVPGEDKLYILLLVSGAYYVYEWGAGDPMSMRFDGRIEQKNSPVFSSFRVRGDFSETETIDFSVSVDSGTETVYEDVSDTPMWTGLRMWGSVIEYSMAGNASIREILFGTTPAELK